MMKAAYLRAKLETLLEFQLGVYVRSDGATAKAIWVGEPNSQWQARGLEVRIAATPSLEVKQVHQGSSLGDTFEVRLISHGKSDLEKAARAVAQTFNASSPQLVPQNDTLGILAQYVFQIKQ